MAELLLLLLLLLLLQSHLAGDDVRKERGNENIMNGANSQKREGGRERERGLISPLKNRDKRKEQETIQ